MFLLSEINDFLICIDVVGDRMPVPKRKRSRARRDSRFANKGVKVKSFSKCSNESCVAPALPHQACKECGFYKGVKVFTTKNERTVKRVESRKASQDRQAARAPKEQPESK